MCGIQRDDKKTLLTNADVVSKSTYKYIGGAPQTQLVAKTGVGQFLVVPEYGVRIHFGVGALVHFYRVVYDLLNLYVHIGFIW